MDSLQVLSGYYGRVYGIQVVGRIKKHILMGTSHANGKPSLEMEDL